MPHRKQNNLQIGQCLSFSWLHRCLLSLYRLISNKPVTQTVVALYSSLYFVLYWHPNLNTKFPLLDCGWELPRRGLYLGLSLRRRKAVKFILLYYVSGFAIITVALSRFSYILSIAPLLSFAWLISNRPFLLFWECNPDLQSAGEPESNGTNGWSEPWRTPFIFSVLPTLLCHISTYRQI